MQHAAETALTSAQQRDLRALAAVMIPPSEEFAVPGADDPAIFDDILRSLGHDRDSVLAALARLAAQAGGSFAGLDAARQDSLAAAFLAGGTPDATILGRVVLQCYYRDDRVVRSLGLEPRPPFPKGHALEQGDWSLLDPVRARPKLWRDAP